VDTLVKDGNLCIAIDFRGHGCSSFEGENTTLIEQPRMLFDDFNATLQFLDTLDLPHSDTVIVLGASMGACVATTASTYDRVLGGVAASAVEDISRNMIDDVLLPKGLFYIAGELDKNEALDIDFGRDANNLYNATTEPSKVLVIPNTPAHGVDLLDANIPLIGEAIAWVRNL
jgi:pimeloyl-ACP methyl ester carboxylesterase